jgi:hypothetical protein
MSTEADKKTTEAAKISVAHPSTPTPDVKMSEAHQQSFDAMIDADDKKQSQAKGTRKSKKSRKSYKKSKKSRKSRRHRRK